MSVLRGNDILLNSRHKLSRFGQRQTEVGEIAKTIRPADRHHVDTLGSTIDPGSNQSRHAFSVEVAGQPTLYGIRCPKWAPNENDFDVEVVSFGWADQNNAGNPNPVTRRRLSADQASDVRALVVALFEDVNARRRIIPFSGKVGQFLREINFHKNWILLRG